MNSQGGTQRRVDRTGPELAQTIMRLPRAWASGWPCADRPSPTGCWKRDGVWRAVLSPLRPSLHPCARAASAGAAALLAGIAHPAGNRPALRVAAIVVVPDVAGTGKCAEIRHGVPPGRVVDDDVAVLAGSRRDPEAEIVGGVVVGDRVAGAEADPCGREAGGGSVAARHVLRERVAGAV